MASLVNIANLFSTHPLTRNAPLRAWARFTLWQIRSRIQKEIVVPWISGQRLAVRRSMAGATGNIYVRLHEFADMMFILHFLRKEDLFIDIGANVGSYTTTWAFEPDPNAVRGLKRNLAINDLNDLVTIYELALGSTECEVPFTIGQDTRNRVATNIQSKNVRLVKQRPLDELMKSQFPANHDKNGRGGEEHVLRGARRLLENNGLKVIDLEWPSSASLQALNSHCFTRAYYDPFTRSLQREPTDRDSSPNALFVRDWEFAISRLTTADRIRVLDHAI